MSAFQQKWSTLGTENRILLVSLLFSSFFHLFFWMAGRGYLNFSSEIKAPSGTIVGLVRSVPGNKTKKNTAGARKKTPVSTVQKQTTRKKPQKVKQVRKDLTHKKDTVSLTPKIRKKPLANTRKKATPTKKSPSASAPDTPSASDRLSRFLKGARQKEGASGHGNSPGVADGDPRASNMALGFYLGNLQQRIHQLWQIPPGYDEPDLQVRFRVSIAANGDLLNKELIQSSGSDLFDNSAAIALEDAAPFGSLPASISAPLKIVIRLLPGE